MQIIDHWPIGSLAIDEPLERALQAYLLEPFEDQTEAEALWTATSTVLIVIQEHDSETLVSHLGDRLCQLIQWAMSFPDDCTRLAPQYEIRMGIICDDGSGVYLLSHDGNSLMDYLADS